MLIGHNETRHRQQKFLLAYPSNRNHPVSESQNAVLNFLGLLPSETHKSHGKLSFLRGFQKDYTVLQKK